MKTLVLYFAHFRLPDEFHGDVAAALRLMADYHEQHSSESEPLTTDDLRAMTVQTAAALVFDQFFGAVRQGKRLAGIMRLAEYHLGPIDA